MKDSERQLITLAERLVDDALGGGAQFADATAHAGWELSAKVRLGEPELVEEAGTRSVSLRVMREQRVAITATSDLTEAGLQRAVADALALLELTEPDPCAGPADPSELASPPFPELELYDEAVAGIDADEALRRATAAERAALAHDARLTLSDGASFSRTQNTIATVLSTGFRGAFTTSYASLVVSPVAEDTGGKKRRGFYWTGGRHLTQLEDHEAVGIEAARRTLQKLGARKVATGEAPVVFDPDVAASLIGTLAGCLLGSSIWRKSSYLLEREGTLVASPLLTIVDDPLRPGAPGSRPFDGEGLPSRRTVVVDKGRLETYLLDCYSARKLGRKSTGSASSGSTTVTPTTTNFIVAPGEQTREALIASVKQGLYVTDMMGFGFNAVTGDYSRGASGFWIENGELAYPVSEITVSSNLDAMLKGIDAVANDLEFKRSTVAPTLKVDRMTIAGE